MGTAATADHGSAAPCRISMLGGLRVSVCGRRLMGYRTRRAARLLAYLAYHPDLEHPRELLAEMFWPDADPEAGRHSLSTELSSLRPLLEPAGSSLDGALLQADRHTVRLRGEALETDVRDFENAQRAAAQAADEAVAERHLATAAELYRGELLPGFYDEWVLPEQQRLQEWLLWVLTRLAGLHERGGDAIAAIGCLRRAACEDPYRPGTHRRLLGLYVQTGQVEAARRHALSLDANVREVLGLDEGVDVADWVGRARARHGAALSAPQQHAPGLPEPASPFIAQSEEHPPLGAVPLGSSFYVERPADAHLTRAVQRGDFLILVRGWRQVGKTSLMARGLSASRAGGARVVLTQIPLLSQDEMADCDILWKALADTLCEQLDLPTRPSEVWDDRRATASNIRRYVRRHVLPNLGTRLVWALDGVDRVVAAPFGPDVFGVLRAWFDERVLEPDGPWSDLTILLAYSTEAHALIPDPNQSPFNVGVRIELQDFTRDQVADLSRRYGSPLRDEAQLARYYALFGGQPYLVQSGLREMVAHRITLDGLEERADGDHWVLGDHLRRIRALATRDEAAADAMRTVLSGSGVPGRAAFLRLRAAGVLLGDTPETARCRCGLYERALRRHFELES